MFVLTASFEGSLNIKEDMNSSQLLLVATAVNELLVTYLTIIKLSILKEFLMIIQVLGSVFKTSKLVVEMDFVSHISQWYGLIFC